jgi:hypothetical protein
MNLSHACHICCYFLSLGSKYFLQNPILKHPQFYVLPLP